MAPTVRGERRDGQRQAIAEKEGYESENSLPTTPERRALQEEQAGTEKEGREIVSFDVSRATSNVLPTIQQHFENDRKRDSPQSVTQVVRHTISNNARITSESTQDISRRRISELDLLTKNVLVALVPKDSTP